MFAHVSEYLSTVTPAGRWTLGGLAVVWTGAAAHLIRQTLILVRIHPRTRALGARLVEAARPVMLDQAATIATEAPTRRPVRPAARGAVRPPQATTAGRRRLFADWRDRTFGEDPVGATDDWAGTMAAWRAEVAPPARRREPITVRQLDRVGPVRVPVVALPPSPAMDRLDAIITAADAAIRDLERRCAEAAAEFAHAHLVTIGRGPAPIEGVIIPRDRARRRPPARRAVRASASHLRRVAA